MAYLRELLQDEKMRIIYGTVSYTARPLVTDGDYFHHQFFPSVLIPLLVMFTPRQRFHVSGGKVWAGCMGQRKAHVCKCKVGLELGEQLSLCSVCCVVSLNATLCCLMCAQEDGWVDHGTAMSLHSRECIFL